MLWRGGLDGCTFHRSYGRELDTRLSDDMTALREHLQRTLSEQYVLDREIGRGGMATVFFARENWVEDVPRPTDRSVYLP